MAFRMSPSMRAWYRVSRSARVGAHRSRKWPRPVCEVVWRSHTSSAATTATAAATASAKSGGKQSKTLSVLGTTAGLACLSVVGSVLAWPLADLWLGPRLVREGLELKRCRSSEAEEEASSKAPAGVACVGRSLCVKTPVVLVLAGGCSSGKDLEHACLAAQRPVIYLPLREGTSPHDFFFGITSGVYSSDRMGFLGVITNSMGVWWTVLFDVIVGHNPNHTRSFHLSIVLQHMRRGLKGFTGRMKDGDVRPLIILDGFDEVGQALHATQKNADCHTAHVMLVKLLNWCCTVCFDDRMADIAICTGPVKSSGWTSMRSQEVEAFSNAHELRRHLKPWLP